MRRFSTRSWRSSRGGNSVFGDALTYLACGLALTATTHAATNVQGLLTADGLTGRNATPKGWGLEFIYIGQLEVGLGGGGGITVWNNPPGWYSITVPNGFLGGRWSMFHLRFDGAPAFAFNDNLQIPGGGGNLENTRLNTPAHYSVMYNSQWTEWSAEPWIWGTDFYQTFKATGPHITRVATKLAGKSGDHVPMFLNFDIYSTNDGPPSGWTKLTNTRTIWISGNTDPIIHIFWVPYHSNELFLTEGETYAARFWRGPASEAASFAIVARFDNNTGYADGMLYSGNTAQPNRDAYAYISGGAEDTVVNFAPITSVEVGDLAGSGVKHGQTFTATGISLAGVETAYATGDPSPPSFQVTFQLYDAPGGNPIGPPRMCYGVPEHYEARTAVFWRNGEVPLVKGNTYYLEWRNNNPSGNNVWFMLDNLEGKGYVNGNPVTEYAGEPPPPPEVDFIGTPSSGTAPITVEFTDQTVAEDVLTRTWDFGDGQMSTLQHPIHLYSTPGQYTVSLTVKSVGGTDTETKVGYINVSANVGDYDKDGDVDQSDYGHLQKCFTAPGVDQNDPHCWNARMDSDLDVDIDDFGLFQGCLSGAGVPFDPGCAD